MASMGVKGLKQVIKKIYFFLFLHCNHYFYNIIYTGFVRVLENLESSGILLWHFPGLESPAKRKEERGNKKIQKSKSLKT